MLGHGVEGTAAAVDGSLGGGASRCSSCWSGVLVLAAIIRFRPSNAERTWRIVAGIVLVLSFATPFSGIPGAPLGYLLALEAMHIVAGALAIWMLPTLARES